MENWLYAEWPVLLKTAVSVVGALLAMLVVVRAAGLRTFAKMSSIDFATTVAIGSILASVILNTGQSLAKGAVALVVIVICQQFFAGAKRRSQRLENILENNPIFLMRGSDILGENLTRSGVTHADLMAKLREANVLQLSEVKYVVLETTGDISVLHGDENVRVDDEILQGVHQ